MIGFPRKGIVRGFTISRAPHNLNFHALTSIIFLQSHVFMNQELRKDTFDGFLHGRPQTNTYFYVSIFFVQKPVVKHLNIILAPCRSYAQGWVFAPTPTEPHWCSKKNGVRCEELTSHTKVVLYYLQCNLHIHCEVEGLVQLYSCTTSRIFCTTHLPFFILVISIIHNKRRQ